jgi:DNA-binding HxlR family transcriptional regulator
MGYADLKRAVVGIGDSVLSERLSELCRAGLVQRIVEEGPPVSVLYQVTPAGQALLPVLEALVTWAQENLPA